LNDEEAKVSNEHRNRAEILIGINQTPSRWRDLGPKTGGTEITSQIEFEDTVLREIV
jgi:hypothetical protein